MKRFLAFVLFVAISGAALAQRSILAGKIVDDKDAPIAGAVLKVSRDGLVTSTRSDDDGLFYTKLLPAGNYHFDVCLGDKRIKAKRVYLPDQSRKKCFYYVKVLGDKVRVSVDGQDPFLRTRLGKIKNQDPRKVRDRQGVYLLKADKATGRPLKLYIPADRPPRVGDSR